MCRLYCSVLVETGNQDDVAMVTTIRYCNKKFHVNCEQVVCAFVCVCVSKTNN